MRKGLFRIFAWLMLAVFIVAITPREYLHDLFSDHTDTIHHTFKKGEFEISSNHKHCSFFGFEFLPHIPGTQPSIHFTPSQQHSCKYTLPAYCFLYSAAVRTIALRGPPSVS